MVGAALGFAATLSLMNIDGFIAQRNLARFEQTGDLDVAYLAQLSPDALPAIVEWAQRATVGQPTELTAQLACQARILDANMRNSSWQSLHAGRQRAWNSLTGLSDSLDGHQVRMEGMVWFVADLEGEKVPCLGVWQD